MFSRHRPALYHDRREAGRKLAQLLSAYKDRPDVIVLGLTRGGVPVAHEVSESLHAAFDALIVRKLGVPAQSELAMGAIASGNVTVLNDDIIADLNISIAEIERVRACEAKEISRREALYRNNRPFPVLKGKAVIVVDDGVATGSTMRAALRAVRLQKPARIIMAVPVASRQACDELRTDADEVICPNKPEPFFAVGIWYEEFSPVADREVREMLSEAIEAEPAAA
ncbi:MAG: phosphoribosyltransferase [Bacteroidota bacterium]|nr:phosphoribosyltransferase [Bacteroidota bacterium]